MRFIDERKILLNALACFKKWWLCINMKNYKNIAFKNFANVIIAVNLNSYEEN